MNQNDDNIENTPPLWHPCYDAKKVDESGSPFLGRADRTIYRGRTLKMREMSIPKMGITSEEYIHEEDCNGKRVAILPFRKFESKFEYLMRMEDVNTWNTDGPSLVCINSGITKMNTPSSQATKELFKYSGCSFDVDRLGKANSVRLSDTVYFLYAVDMTDYKPSAEHVDDDKTVWVSDEEVMDSPDSLASQLYIRLLRRRSSFKKWLKETQQNLI